MRHKTIAGLMAMAMLAIGFIGMSMVQTGCSSMTPEQQKASSAVIGSAENLANVLLPVAATIYGGPNAGQATQDSLYSLENQLNPIVGKTVPIAVVQNATGTAALDKALVDSKLIKPGNKLTVADIQTIDAAAKIAPALAAALQKPSAQRDRDLRRIARYLDRRLGRNVTIVWVERK